MLEYAVNTFFVIAIPASLVLVVLGLLPDREPALYLTAVVLGLFWAAIALMFLVYEQCPYCGSSGSRYTGYVLPWGG